MEENSLSYQIIKELPHFSLMDAEDEKLLDLKHGGG